MSERYETGTPPDWVEQKPGDESKWRRPTGIFSAFGRLVRALFNRQYHEPCGGKWRLVGTSGLTVPSLYFRCDRCGAQSGKMRMEY